MKKVIQFNTGKMAAISDNKYDVFNWIIKVYDSCETLTHIRKVERLIENFYKMYDDYTMYVELGEYYFRVSDRLKHKTGKQLLKG